MIFLPYVRGSIIPSRQDLELPQEPLERWLKKAAHFLQNGGDEGLGSGLHWAPGTQGTMGISWQAFTGHPVADHAEQKFLGLLAPS